MGGMSNEPPNDDLFGVTNEPNTGGSFVYELCAGIIEPAVLTMYAHPTWPVDPNAPRGFFPPPG